MSARQVPRSSARTRLPGDPREERVLYLMGLLTHPDPGVRGRAVEALGQLQDPAALDSLLIALHDADRRVQHRAVRALGALGDPRAIPPLRYLCPRVDRDLRAAIGEAQREIAAGQAGGW